MNISISEFGHINCCKLEFQSNISNRVAYSADPDETARYEPSHQDPHRLQWYMYWSAGLKVLTVGQRQNNTIFL